MLPYITHRQDPAEMEIKEIPKEVLDRLLEAGRLSPSIKKRQPWRFICISDAGRKQELLPICYGDERCKAGASIIVCSASQEYTLPNGLNANIFDLGLATSQIMNQAESEGLSVELCTSFLEKDLAKFLSLPYGMYAAAILILGYPKTAERNDMRLGRLSADRTINYQRW